MSVTTQISREFKDIEDQKIALMRSAKAQADAANLAASQGQFLNPDFNVAAQEQDQINALARGRAGIGSFQPFMDAAANTVGMGANTLQDASSVLRGADTRGQFSAAQQALNQSAVPIGQMANAAQLAGSGVGLIGQGAQGIADAQGMANRFSQALLTPSQNLLSRSVDAMDQARPDFAASQFMMGQGLGRSDLAAQQAQAAANQQGFQQGIGSLQAGADMGRQVAGGLGSGPTAQAAGAISAAQQNSPSMQAARTGFTPGLETFQMGPAERIQAQSVGTPLMSAAQSGFGSQGLQAAQMDPAERVTTQSMTDPGTMQQFMSPYQQAVTDISLREVRRQDDIARQGRNASAVRAGAFGGSRQALQESEAARNLAQLQSDIQSRGLQEGFQSGQQQFNTEQQARLAAQQANQQAGLTVGSQNLGAQQATTQMGFGADLQVALANLSSSQQSNVQNQAAQLQAQGMNAQQALQAAMSNQQAGLTVGSQNLGAQQATQQLGAQTGLQTALANLSSEQQANVQNQAAQLQTQGMNAQQAMQAALANQGVQQQTNLANQSMQGQFGLQGAQLGMQAAGMQQGVGQAQLAAAGQQGQLGLQAANQQAAAGQAGLAASQQLSGQEAQRLAAQQQAAQFSGNVGQTLGQQELQQAQLGQASAGMQGSLSGQLAGLSSQYGNIGSQQANIFSQQGQQLQQLGQGIGNLAGQQFDIGAKTSQGLGALGTQQGNLGMQQAALGGQQQAMGQQDANFQFNLGSAQQRQKQAENDAARQNQLQKNMQPYQQIGFVSDIYRGAPTSQMQMTQQTQAAPSPFQQATGLGIAALGAVGAGSRAGVI